MRCILLAAMAIAGMCIAMPVHAQQLSPVEVSGGYQWLGLTKENETESFPAGWYGDVAFNLNRVLGLVAHGSGSYDHRANKVGNEGWVFDTAGDLSIHTVAGGVRVHDRRASRATLFGQFLTGLSRMSVTASTTVTAPGGGTSTERIDVGRSYLSVHAGGGMNFSLTSRLGFRVAGGWFRIFHGGESKEEFPLFAGNGTNGFEMTTGLIVAIGQ